jgi:hypothetical protein
MSNNLGDQPPARPLDAALYEIGQAASAQRPQREGVQPPTPGAGPQRPANPIDNIAKALHATEQQRAAGEVPAGVARPDTSAQVMEYGRTPEQARAAFDAGKMTSPLQLIALGLAERGSARG